MQYYISVYGVSYTDLESGNYTRLLDNGAAYQIRTEDRPVDADSKLNNPNLFIADTWRIGRRVTANLGLRFEHHDLFSRGGVKQASQFGTPATYGEMDILTWNGVAPRVGASWDILGNGRTVLKGQWGRYLHMAAANFGSSFNPATATVTTFTWHDRNNNLLYDAGRGEPRPEWRRLRQPRAAVERVGHQHHAPAARQPGPGTGAHRRNVADPRAGARQRHVVPWAAGLQEGGRRRTATSRSCVRTRRGTFRSRARIPVPTARRAPPTTAGWSRSGTSTRAYRGAAFEPTSPVNRDSDHDDTYKGFELTLTKRQSNGWMALGSFQMIKNHVWTGLSATPSSPNDEFFPLDQTWDWSGKLMGSYRAPYEITVSALYNFLAGVPRQRTFAVPQRAERDTVTLPLEELGAQRDPAQHVVNLKAMRPIRLGGSRRLSLSFDVFNLFNVNTATTVRYVSSSTYGAISAILPPRIARIGAEFSF